jgi:hypothetical protein
MRKAGTFDYIFGLVELNYLNLYGDTITPLLMFGRKDPIPSLKGYCGLLEKASEKMFQGAL